MPGSYGTGRNFDGDKQVTHTMTMKESRWIQTLLHLENTPESNALAHRFRDEGRTEPRSERS